MKEDDNLENKNFWKFQKCNFPELECDNFFYSMYIYAVSGSSYEDASMLWLKVEDALDVLPRVSCYYSTFPLLDDYKWNSMSAVCLTCQSPFLCLEGITYSVWMMAWYCDLWQDVYTSGWVEWCIFINKGLILLWAGNVWPRKMIVKYFAMIPSFGCVLLTLMCMSQGQYEIDTVLLNIF